MSITHKDNIVKSHFKPTLEYKNVELDMLKIGVVGVCKKKFNYKKAEEYLTTCINFFKEKYNPKKIIIVSGVYDIGVSSLANQIAHDAKYRYIGISPKVDKNLFTLTTFKTIHYGKNFGERIAYF